MIPRILDQLAKGRQEFSWKELCYRLVPCATVMRWRARARAGEPLLEKPGPKKPEPLNLQLLKAKIAQLDHGRRRSDGTTALQGELSNSISRRRFQELVAEERQQHLDHMKRIEWLVPGTVWSFDTTEYGPQKLKITPLRDLASKYQLPVPLVGAHENGACQRRDERISNLPIGNRINFASVMLARKKPADFSTGLPCFRCLITALRFGLSSCSSCLRW
jgi:hypothetical protein